MPGFNECFSAKPVFKFKLLKLERDGGSQQTPREHRIIKIKKKTVALLRIRFSAMNRVTSFNRAYSFCPTSTLL